MTKQRRAELLRILADIQNDDAHAHHDIMTITGFMQTEQEILDHIERNRSLVKTR